MAGILTIWYRTKFAAKLYGRVFWAALIMFAVLSWYTRNPFNSDALKSIILAFFVGDVIGFIIALLGKIGNVVNDLGWLNVIIYFLFAIGFADFQFKKVSKTEPL